MMKTTPHNIAVLFVAWASALAVSPPAAASDRTAPDRCQGCSAPTKELVFEAGDSLVGLLGRVDVAPAAALRIAEALEPIMDPGAIAPGARMSLRFAPTKGVSEEPTLRQLILKTGPDRRIVVRPQPKRGYVASVQRPEHERSVQVEVLPIETSLYASAVAANASTRLIFRAQRVLGNRVDFQRELRPGDRIAVAYERLAHPRSGERHAGKLLAVSLQQRERAVSLYRFEQGDKVSGFFDKEGASVQLALLRNPVRRARLSSSFGPREHPILDYARMHEGLDYAAARGARVVAAGNGRVVRAGRNGSYGNYVQIEHDDGLSTAYAHLSGFADGLEPGVRVAQGDTIGYVGQTGLATGPNLHYEVQRNGKPVNPAELELPARRRLQGDALKAFQTQRRRLNRVVARQVAEQRESSVDLATADDYQDTR